MAREYNIPVVFTAHDFYFICPSIKLLNQDGKVCVGRSDCKCVECLHSLLGITDKVDYIKSGEKMLRSIKDL